MNKRENITFEDRYTRLENVTVHCEMKINVPMHSNLQDFTKFMQSTNRVKQYTHDVIGSLSDKHTVDFSKVSIDNIHHIANLNDLNFNVIHRDTHKNELTYMLTMWKNTEDFNCYLIFTVS